MNIIEALHSGKKVRFGNEPRCDFITHKTGSGFYHGTHVVQFAAVESNQWELDEERLLLSATDLVHALVEVNKCLNVNFDFRLVRRFLRNLGFEGE